MANLQMSAPHSWTIPPRLSTLKGIPCNCVGGQGSLLYIRSPRQCGGLREKKYRNRDAPPDTVSAHLPGKEYRSTLILLTHSNKWLNKNTPLPLQKKKGFPLKFKPDPYPGHVAWVARKGKAASMRPSLLNHTTITFYIACKGGWTTLPFLQGNLSQYWGTKAPSIHPVPKRIRSTEGET